MVPILINKYVFEPSYKDLKFMVQNCIYFCTNLISVKPPQTLPPCISFSLGWFWSLPPV